MRKGTENEDKMKDEQPHAKQLMKMKSMKSQVHTKEKNKRNLERQSLHDV